MWKIINKIQENDLNFIISTSDRRGIKVQVPPLRREASQRARTLYEESFGVVAPKLWNTLPRNSSLITNKCSFKTNLSKYLSHIPDRPPVDGFASRNSLINMNRLQITSPGGRAPAAASAVVPTTAASAPEDDDGPHQL